MVGLEFMDKIMNQAALFFMDTIKDRTLKGKNVDGQSFSPYSNKYKLLREDKGLPSRVVDLFFTGSMMASMSYEIKDNDMHIYFLPTRDKKGSLNPAKASGLNKKREFFALSLSEIKEGQDFIEREMMKEIDRIK